jgi:hypothetical protein
MSRRKLAVVMLCFLLTAGATAIAQTTGNIRGTVTDETGAVLPGAAVTIYSDAIIGGSRATVTNEIGVYRFPSQAVGTYAVEVTVEGFETHRVENVEVAIGRTATINVPIKLATLAESITVTSASPVVDVTQSGVSTSFKNEMVHELPTHRNFFDYIQISPGMSAIYSGTGGADRTVAFGSNQQSNSWNIDGIETSSPETGSSWLEVNPDNIEEVKIMGVGAPAEFGNAIGAVFNVVTKKGGDDFHGGTAFFFQHDSLTDTNVSTEDLEFYGYEPFPFQLDKFWDVTARIGGPVAREKAWFYASADVVRYASRQPGVDPSLFGSDLYTNERWDFKGTVRLAENHELSTMFHISDWDYISGGNPFVAESAAYVERGTTLPPVASRSLSSTTRRPEAVPPSTPGGLCGPGVT